jgi:uncharacterized protein (DUF2062 family)
MSISLGVLVGVTPLYGFHTFIILFLASVFRLNKVISFLFTRISIPPLFPFIVGAALFLGAPFVKQPVTESIPYFSISFLKNNLYQYLIGTAVLGISLAVISGVSSYFLLELRQNKNK